MRPKDGKADDKPKRLDPLKVRKQRNPKAFAINAPKAAERRARRKQDIEEKRMHIPVVDRTPLEPPPVLVAVVGPPKSGKTTLVRSLVKYFTRHGISDAKGPITCVTGKKRRITLLECNNDINCMIDVAKVADLILLLVDSSFGLEMELFEFLNICQSHGFPKIMVVLTHLDKLKTDADRKAVKKSMKKRVWTEIYKGAKLFFVYGLQHGLYSKRDTQNIARTVSVMKFRPLTWQTTHPYALIDRIEDLTDSEQVRRNPQIDRKVSLYGYVRGVPLVTNSDIHIPGCGDFRLNHISTIPDPCPLPKKGDKQRRSLTDKDKNVYAPFSGVGGVYFDKDAVYIDVGGSHSFAEKLATQDSDRIVNRIMENTLDEHATIDNKLRGTKIQLFKGSEPMSDPESEPEDAEQEDEESSDDAEFEEECEGMNLEDHEKAEIKYYEREKRDYQKLVYGNSAIFALDDEPDERTMRPTENSVECTIERSKRMDEYSLESLLSLVKKKFIERRPEEETEDYGDDDDDMGDEDDGDEEYDDFIDYEAVGNKYDPNNGVQPGNEDIEFDDDEDEADLDDGDYNEAAKRIAATDDKSNEDKERMLAKLRKKGDFDAQYDKGDLGATDEGQPQPEKTYYALQKEKLQEQADMNRTAFESLDEDIRVQVEGFRSGLYVRMELNRVPAALVNSFNPEYPLIVGGLGAGESGEGYVRVRFKKHRWFKKILKTRDPLIVSMGWRRFQTVPVYHMTDDNMRNRALKYTPWHLHCLATFWAPLAPQGTGLVAFQQIDQFTEDFRISGTGVVLDLDKSVDIVKKLKLVGSPCEVFTKTAFIKGMFNSALEVAKFEKAPLRTVSGIRGVIQKAIKTPEGAFRATFEDKILLSDIVFLRTWYSVDVPRFCVTIKTLLMPKEDRDKWIGARSIGRIRAESNLKSNSSNNADSIYKPVARKQFNFRPFTIPKELQRALPYKDKPKFIPKQDDKIKRVSAVKTEGEKRRLEALIMMSSLQKDRMLKRKEAKLKKIA